MDVAEMLSQYVNFGNSVYREGYLDEQFTQLQELVDENHSMFLLDVISAFFIDAEKLLDSLTNALENHVIHFEEVTEMIHTLKGSSSSFGAKKMNNICITFKNYSEEKNLQGCVSCLHKVKQEFSIVRSKLESLSVMQQQIMAAGGVVPVIE